MTSRTKRGHSVEGKRGNELIRIADCSVIFDRQAVLDGVNFSLRAGERWALVGPNGSGKTVFLKLLRGDIWPTPTGRERREYRLTDEPSEYPEAKERIAYIGPERQDKYVRYGWNHSAAQVIGTGFFDEEIPRTPLTAAQHRRVAALLKSVGLWSLRSRGFLTLSYGQRRRVLLARALAGNPLVLLLDEVFNGLDAYSAKTIRRVLARTKGMGATWILTTHRAEDVPANATNFARMRDGRVEEAARPKESRRAPRVEHPKARARSVGEPLIVLKGVDLYRDYRLIVRDIDWTIRRGEHWAIMGRNGSGKSTLLKLLYGDLHPRLGGSIERDGAPFGTPIANWKARVGFVAPELQADHFLARDLEEVVVSGRYASIGLNDEATARDRRLAARWLDFFGIGALAKRRPRAVSYGQMRLALVARAMINDPELLLLDEPCTGLDTDMRALVLKLLESVAQQGVQLVMAVHHQEDLPACVTKLVRIGTGRKIAISNLVTSSWQLASSS